jgi:hypothetical protein
VDGIQPRTAERSSWTSPLSEGQALALIGHLVSSAELCLYEPELYGSFRLLDATSRLLGMLLGSEPAQHDAFLLHLKEQIDQKKIWMLYDRSGYHEFVHEAPVMLARRLKEVARSERGDEGHANGEQP